MEAAGISMDDALFQELGRELDITLKALGGGSTKPQAWRSTWPAPNDSAEVLFEKLNLPVLKKTSKTKSFSTDNEVLESLRAVTPSFRWSWTTRNAEQAQGHLCGPRCRRQVDPATGRVHAKFNQTVAATGRLSSSDPNLQNIPMKGGWGPKIRQRIRRRGGSTSSWARTTPDRAAHLAASLQGRFAPEGHRAGRAHPPPPPQRSSTWAPCSSPRTCAGRQGGELRHPRGMGPFGLARELGVSQRDAKAFIERYFARFPQGQGLPGRRAGPGAGDGGGDHPSGSPAPFSRHRPRRQAPPAGAPSSGHEHAGAGLRGGPHQESHGGGGNPSCPRDAASSSRSTTNSSWRAPRAGAEEAERVLKHAMVTAMALRVPLAVTLPPARGGTN